MNRQVRTQRAAERWNSWRMALVALVTTVAVLPVSAQAEAASGEWEWRATLYAWLPDIEGTTRFPSGAGGPTIGVDAGQLIDNLDFTFMAAVQVRKGRWGAFGDLIYLDEGAAQSRVRDFTVGPGQSPAGVELDANLDLRSWVLTLAGTYRLGDAEDAANDLLFGTRMLDLEQTLDWRLSGNIGELDLPSANGSSTVSGTNWDAVIGVKGSLRFGRDSRWLVPWHLDAGAGDSDFTWQAMAGVGYRFDWGSMLLNYRYLDYDLGSGAGVNDLTLSGPLLGVSVQW